MKKSIAVFAFILTTFVGMAQVTPSFGIRGGLSSSNIKGDAVSSLQSLMDFTDGAITTGNRTGFFAGGYATIPLSEKVSLEPAVYYAQKGYVLNGALDIKGIGFLGANAKAQLNAQYIDVPLVLKGNFGGFQVFAGAQVSYLTQAQLQTTAGVLGINLLNRKIEATDNFNRWDAGLTGGIGYQFANGLNVTAAYDHGLSKMDANKSMNAYNRSIKVGIGMSF